MRLKYGKMIVKNRKIVLIVCLLLLIPAIYGYLNTGINYDILSYLPEDIETMKGQDILVEEFGNGAFSFILVDKELKDKDVAQLRADISEVDHVVDAIWYDSFLDLNMPMEMLPSDVYEKFNSEETTLMAVIYDETSSATDTIAAEEQIRGIVGDRCKISGMTSTVIDIRDLSDKETPVYVVLAVILSLTILLLTMESFVAPLLFLASIGIAIIYNLGSNVFMGEISYVTQALAAVLQLGVTMDYSIFLWHSYQEQLERYNGDTERAMAHAISNTITSVAGSSITTLAGFVALCFMSFTLGLDLGIVMAKGVLFGVITCVTLLPALLLTFNKALEKTKHKKLLPSLEKPMKFVNKHYIILAVIFAILWFPAVWGNNHTAVYYDLAGTLPEELQSISASNEMREQYDMNTVDMVLLDVDTPTNKVNEIMTQLESVDGITNVVGIDSIIGPVIPEDMVPDTILDVFESENYKMIMALSSYKVGSDESNDQVDEMTTIIKSIDENAMLVGEAPCTKDLIDITNHDFQVVSAVSIGLVFLIIALLFRSISIPVVLISVIEFAIYVNMGIPAFTGTELPFIASIVIGTVQLGATVDYAILMTTRYKKERTKGLMKKEAVSIAHVTSTESILVSAFSFFAATFGVGLYSQIDMISSLCILMARGALISMVTVLLVLPSMLIIFDPIIIRTSMGFKEARKAKVKQIKA